MENNKRHSRKGLNGDKRMRRIKLIIYLFLDCQHVIHLEVLWGHCLYPIMTIEVLWFSGLFTWLSIVTLRVRSPADTKILWQGVISYLKELQFHFQQSAYEYESLITLTFNSMKLSSWNQCLNYLWIFLFIAGLPCVFLIDAMLTVQFSLIHLAD